MSTPNNGSATRSVSTTRNQVGSETSDGCPQSAVAKGSYLSSQGAGENSDQYVLVRLSDVKAKQSDYTDQGVTPGPAKAGTAAMTSNADVKARTEVASKAVSVRSQVNQQLMQARQSLQPISIVVPYSFSMSCAVGTGIVSSAQLVLADSNNAEWNALVALYDEYRVSGGTVKYQLPYTSPNLTSGLTADSMFVMAYDPTDSTALTSVREGCELSQHTLVSGSQILVDAIAGTTRVGYFNSLGAPHQFKFHLKEVEAPTINLSGAINFSAGMWKSANAAGGNSPDGSLKVYGTSSNTTAVVCVAGIVYLRVHFRSRK